MKKYVFMVVAVIAALCSCSKDDDSTIDGVVAWENELSMGKFEDGVSRIVIETGINISSYKADDTHKPLNAAGTLWEVLDGKVLRIQTSGSKIMGHDSFTHKDLKFGLDAANGASWMIAKSVFDALGAQTFVINNTPSGVNINDASGSTYIEPLVKFVKENSLDVGFAFDGDGDRCIAVDELGHVVDGDKILYLLASRFQAKGILNKNTIVTTSMSNTGLYSALKTLFSDLLSLFFGIYFSNIFCNLRNNFCISFILYIN